MDTAVLGSLSWAAILSIFVVLAVFFILVFSRLSADYVFLGGLGVLLLSNVLSPTEALAGFSSSGMITVGVLYIVVCGLRETGGLTWIVTNILGRPKTVAAAQLRLMFPVASLSAFLNNTPVVAIFIPAVLEWSGKIRVSASRLLIPLSYASIFGGICTLIGTSTNLVVHGLVQARYQNDGLAMFEITKIGVPCAILGIFFVVLFRHLLPERSISTMDSTVDSTMVGNIDGEQRVDSELVTVESQLAMPPEQKPCRRGKSGTAFFILVMMIFLAACNYLSMLKAAVLAAGLMLICGCCSVAQARRSLEWSVLLTIAAALGLGTALDKTGAAHGIAAGFLSLVGNHAWSSLIMVYFVTTLFTEFITNNAAAALVFPIAMSTAELLNVSPMPFIMCVMVGASASFATPIGYQTNLMVYEPGGYKFSDYLRIGIPLNLWIGVICVVLAPLIWPF